MGHNRLGRLPKYVRWNQVVALLDTAPTHVQPLAAATALAADRYFRTLAGDPSLAYCFWLLARVTWAARSEDFTAELSSLGVSVDADVPAIGFIASLSDHVRIRLAQNPGSGPVSELASLALRRALTETVGIRERNLFGSRLEDLQHAFRTYSTQHHFSDVAQRFFGDFMARTLRSYIDRELANHVGPGNPLATVTAGSEFIRALDLHTRQAAAIVHEFAGSWYSKHNWTSRGAITQEEAQGFVAVALRKLRSELKRDEP